MADHDKRALSSGCRDDFYNQVGNSTTGQCWSLKSAKVVKRWRLGWWTSPVQPGAFQEVRTLSCHYEPGRCAFYEALPSHAVQPVRLGKKP